MTNHHQSDKADHKLAKAIRLVPSNQRERYTSEWQADLAGANPQERYHVASAALAMARRLRLSDIGSTLLGGHGVARAFAWWVGITAFVVLVPFFPKFLIPVLVPFICAALFYAGVPSKSSYWLMVASIIGAVASLTYFIVAFRVAFNAADNSQAIPRWASFDGLALLSFLLFVVLFFLSILWSFFRTRHN